MFIIGQTNDKKILVKPIKAINKPKNAVFDSVKSLDSTSAYKLKLSKISKDSVSKEPKKDIESTINYSAEDSITLDAEEKTAILYTKSKVLYGSKDIQADRITISYQKNQVDASYKIDSTGKKIGIPVFKEGSETYVAEEIKYNYKTKRGLVKEIITKQGEGYIHGEILKKDSLNNMYVNHAIYTTCNLKHPHFAIKANKIKMVGSRKMISGPFYMSVGDIPTPLAFIFGFFPVPKRRSSGLIMPEYGESRDRGFFFKNGGLYLAFGDKLGVSLKGDIYTLGGFALRTNIDYNTRYKYTGKLSLQFNKFIQNPDIDYLKTVSKDVWIQWTHRPELKGRSYQFSANVNAGSSTYNSRASFNPTQRQTANFNSTINFSKSFRKIPIFLNVTARQDQNVSTKTMTFDLPTANISMNRQMPFKNVISSNKAIWDPIKKLGISYSFDMINRINNIVSTPRPADFRVAGATEQYYRPDTIRLLSDTLMFGNEMRKFFGNSKYGIKHSIPISTTMRVFKYFNLNPSMNFNEYWYQRKFKYSDWNSTDSTVKIDTLKGLARANTVNFNASLTTRVYGTVFIRKFNIEAIRHTMIPTIGFSYSPDLSQNSSQNVKIGQDATGDKFKKLNTFEDAVGLGGPTGTKFKTLNLGLSNTIEMKIRDKSDTIKKSFKKVMLLDNLSASGLYNLNVDSFKLSNIVINARTKLFKKFDINFNAVLDPYYIKLDSIRSDNTVFQKRQKEYAINKGQGLGQIIQYNVSLGTSFTPKGFTSGVKNPNTYVEPYELRLLRRNYLQYVDWNIPWTLSVQYILNYSKVGYVNSRYDNNITINGNLSVTQKWKVTASTSYNVNTKQYGYTNLGIVRDLHCWDLSLSWVPFGLFQSYSVNLAVKASTLRDLKLSRQRSWYDN